MCAWKTRQDHSCEAHLRRLYSNLSKDSVIVIIKWNWSFMPEPSFEFSGERMHVQYAGPVLSQSFPTDASLPYAAPPRGASLGGGADKDALALQKAAVFRAWVGVELAPRASSQAVRTWSKPLPLLQSTYVSCRRAQMSRRRAQPRCASSPHRAKT